MSAEPLPPAHCACCVHNPASPDVQELLRRVNLTPIAPAWRVIATLVAPEAIADILKWHQAEKPSSWAEAAKRASRLPKLAVEFVAHATEIEVVVKEMKVRSYRKRNTR